MAKNKIIFNNEVLLDLTNDDVTASDVVSGKTFHTKDGNQGVGSLVIQKYYVGSSEPSSSFGNNGDIYLVK